MRANIVLQEEEVESSDLVLDHSELDQILDPTDQILDRTDQILDRTDQVSDPTAAGPVSDAQSPLPISEKVEVANGGTHTMDNSAKVSPLKLFYFFLSNSPIPHSFEVNNYHQASVHNKACAVIDTLTSPKSKRKRGSSKKAEKQKVDGPPLASTHPPLLTLPSTHAPLYSPPSTHPPHLLAPSTLPLYPLPHPLYTPPVSGANRGVQ